MRLHELLPEWDVRSHHETFVRADADRCYEAIRSLDLGRSRLSRLLFLARGLGAPRRITLDEMRARGFVVLAEEAPRELILGLIARPWWLFGGIQRIAAGKFATFDKPGFARIGWSFFVEPVPGGCRVATETRILCTDDRSRLRFRIYWRVVGPFSGVIRREALRLIRTSAERANPERPDTCAYN